MPSDYKYNTEEIEKKIHLLWFGSGKKDNLIKKCENSIKNILQDYEIKNWTEENFDINSHSYTEDAYKNKKYAFVSDYARLKILYEEGGIYLDSDMYIIKSFDDFLSHDLALGKEDGDFISAGMIACKPNNTYIKDLLDYYDSLKDRDTIPRIMTHVFEKNKDKYKNENMNIKIFEPKYFYPFDANNIKKFNFKNAPKESYAVHMWNYSWGHPLNKIIKRIGLHSVVKSITEKLGIKKIIKKILKME